MENSESTALSFRGVSKVYETAGGGTRTALDDVSFDVTDATTLAVVGRSGSGKSTLLHLAAGVDVPTSGNVLVHGKELATMTEEARTHLRRDAIGLVFQFFYLMQHLTVRDNVALPAMIAGEKPKLFEPRVMDLLDRVGLVDRAGDSVQKLSGGEMQRVAICRALLRNPKLLLADEPTGNLDDENGSRVMELMLSLAAAEGATLMYVTHSRDFAKLADAVWTIHDGRISHS